MEDQSIAVCVGIVMVGLILCFALYQGVDGTLLATGLTIIGTMIGYMFGVKVESQKVAKSEG